MVSFIHSVPESVVAGWAAAVQWIGFVKQAVVQFRIRITQLFLHMMTTLLWGKLMEYLNPIKTYSLYYWSKMIETFRKPEKKERKIMAGLECNITLPSSGEEAIKRILACKEKDPYSILGLMQNCSNDDIKKYYRRQAFLVHPDKNKEPGSEDAFKIVLHAYEVIREPEKRQEYDDRLAAEFGARSAVEEWLAAYVTRLQEKANTFICSKCEKGHKRIEIERPLYAARFCARCNSYHSARENDVWAESTVYGFRWNYYACMEGTVYDITEIAACKRETFEHLPANSHEVIVRYVSSETNPRNNSHKSSRGGSRNSRARSQQRKGKKK